MRTRTLLRAFAAATAFLAAAAPAPAADGSGFTASVEPAVIAAGTFYHGATITVRGSVDADSQVVVRVLGPAMSESFNRRGKIGGLIWGGVEHVTFNNLPSLYGVYSSAALASLGDAALRNRLKLGYESLAAGMELEGTGFDRERLFRDLFRLKEKEGYFRIVPGAVTLGDAHEGRRVFEVAVPVPPATRPGDIEVAVFEMAGGRPVGESVAPVRLAQVGLPAALYRLAHEQALLFGLLALVISLITGLGIGLFGGALTRGRGRAPVFDVLALAGEPSERSFHPDEEHVPKLLRLVSEPLLSSRAKPRTEDEVSRMRDKYTLFRRLLALNNELLESLAELEEESSWTSFRHPRVRMGIRALFDGTGEMVGVLNELCGGRYFDLATVVESIRKDVADYIAKAPEQEDPRLTLALSEVSSRTAPMAGGKAVNLARLEADLDLAVPPSFVVTTEAYRLFLESGDLASKLRTVLAPARLDAPQDFQRRCELAAELVERTPVPPAVAEAVAAAYRALDVPAGEGVAVRSSATGEDTELSFAGQFDSFLNVPRSELVDAWRRVLRSRFSPRAVFYRRACGLAEVDTPMAVLVQRMAPARSSGVLFTRRPDEPKANVLVITAVPGLGSDASAGTAAADELVVSRKAPHRIVSQRVARKTSVLRRAAEGGIERVEVGSAEEERPVLSADDAAHLARVALSMERYFDTPQDVEWAIGEDDEVWILQSRPLRTGRPHQVGGAAPRDAVVLLEGGDPVWPGRAVGPAHVARTAREQENVPHGAVLVVSQLLADAVRLLPRVAGVVVEHGSTLGHAASLAREFRVPSLFGVAGATAVLASGDPVSLDAAGRRVYAGEVWPELRGKTPMTLLGRRSIGLPRVLSSKLTKLSGSAFVSSWTCQSLHDVIRFVHERAIQSMFEISDRLRGSKIGGVVQLETPPDVYLHLVDLGGGIRREAAERRRVGPADVVCTPFKGLWRGLGDQRIERGTVARGHGSFTSVMVTTLTGDPTRPLGMPNYACVTDTYLNLNSRQAYHFAIVDAHLSDNVNGNHISVRMRGGGAAPWQRSLRVEFMADVLRQRGFTAEVTSDLLNAWCRGVDVASGLDALASVGRLLRFSAQLDLWMTAESQVRELVQTFLAVEEGCEGAPAGAV